MDEALQKVTFTNTQVKLKAYLITAKIGTKTVGRAYVYLIYNKLHKAPYALLEDVYVDKAYRGKGIGSKLVVNAIDLAKELGCYKIIATSRFARERVHKLYEKLGFNKWGYEFRIDF